jgi:hypothetical protein
MTPAPRFSGWWVPGALTAVALSFTSLYWLFSLPRSDYRTELDRTAFAFLVLCLVGIASFGWAAALAYFGRARKWTPKICLFAGLSFVVPILIFAAFAVKPGRAFGLLTSGFMASGLICRKLTYPHVSNEELNVPEPPLSLFPR